MSVKRYDFDCYAFYDSARLSVNECEDGDYVLHSDYAAIEAKYNEAVENGAAMSASCCPYQRNGGLWHDDLGHYRCGFHEKYNALREAVAWERECCQDIRPLVAWAGLYVLHGEDYVDAVAEALREIQDAARAEVDRLIANDGAADCENEQKTRVGGGCVRF